MVRNIRVHHQESVVAFLSCIEPHTPPESATMTIGQSMLDEFDQEMATTRRVLERVPSEKGTWKPHEKSFSIGHLAQLVARMPGWISLTVNHPKLDLSQATPYSYEPT